MDERGLVQLCVQGVPGAWESLHAAFLPLLRGAVRDVLVRFQDSAGAEEVQDVVQSIFVHLMEENGRRLRSYRGEAPLGAWMRSVAVRFTLSQFRGKTRFRGRSLDSLPFLTEVEAQDEPLPVPAAMLDRAMHGLIPRDRLILKMRYFDNLSYRSIAHIVGVPVNTLCPMLSRARTRLREVLQESGGSGIENPMFDEEEE